MTYRIDRDDFAPSGSTKRDGLTDGEKTLGVKRGKGERKGSIQHGISKMKKCQ